MARVLTVLLLAPMWLLVADPVRAMDDRDLAAAVAAQTDLPPDLAGRAVDAVFAAIAQALVRGDPVRVTGFGSFDVRTRAPIQGRNPRTGEPVSIPAAVQVRFRAHEALREALGGPRSAGPSSE